VFAVTVSEKDGPQSTYSFDKTEVSIGRVKGNDIVLPKGNVSKRHSRIVVKDGKFIVVDLKSTNGTYVNGRKITSPQVIKTNDKVYIGDFVLSIQESAAAGAAPDAPAPMPGPGGGIQEMNAPAPPPSLAGQGPSAPIAPRKSSPAMPQAAPLPPVASKPLPPAKPLPKPAKPAMSQRAGAPGPSPLSGSPAKAPIAPPRPGPIGGPATAQNTPAVQPRNSAPPLAPPLAAPPGPSAPMMAPAPVAPPPQLGAMPSVYTPGAGIVLTKPEFVQQRDEGFAQSQADAAQRFFATVDVSTLPAFYPPSAEDRAQWQGAATDAAQGNSELADHLLSEIVGLGPLENLLDDQNVEEIYVNSFDQILTKQGNRVSTAARAYSHPDFLFLAAQRLLGARLEDPTSEPAEEVRFSDGTRVHILMPPLAPRGPVLTVRKSRGPARSLDTLASSGVMSTGMAEMLRQAVDAGRTILVAGASASARDELLGALGAGIADGTRIVLVENSGSVHLPQNSVVNLDVASAGQYDTRYLLRAALRMAPERILVNTLQGGEAYEWVAAAAAGTSGSLATVHGSSSKDAIGRLQSLAQLGAYDASPRGLREQIARAVHLVAVVHTDGNGQTRVQQISEVQGVDMDAFRINDVFYWRSEAGGGNFVATGYVPMFYEALRAAGQSVDTSIFG
jgi:pilus assembly protein CpaF